MKSNYFFTLISMLLIIGAFTACEYEFIDPIDPQIITDTISFKDTIVPIWNTTNNCTSCHKTGATKPDLTPSKAYNSIISLELINDTIAENSKIYTKPAPGSTHYGKYTVDESNLILNWIKQGAKDN